MRFPLGTVKAISCIVLLYGCSSSIFQSRSRPYEAPAMGAESRFDEGLRREKHPQQLFSKKERKDMEKMGLISADQRSAPNTRITRGRADSLLTGKTDSTATAADSTATAADSTATAADSTATAADSTHTSTDSTAAPKDTAYHPTSY